MGMGVIDTIIFDLGEVYLTGFLGVEKKLEQALGIDSDEIYEKIRGKELEALFHGKIREETYLNKIIAKNGWKIKPQTMKELIRENFTEIKGTRKIIERLKKEGFKLGLLSVHSKEWVDFCEDKFDYHKLFDSTSYSFEVGFSKPERRSFKIILEKLDTEPQNCLFVDDNLRNLQAARALGIQTILFTSPKQLEEELANLNLLS